MEIKGQIIAALNTSLVGQTQTIRQATQFLIQLRDKAGFCMALMQITDDNSLNIHVRQGALVQLKNSIKSRWQSTSKPLNQEQKNIIKNTLITAIIRSSKQKLLLKLYKEILTIIITRQHTKWNPLDIIIAKLNNKQDIQAVLHCLIGIISAFQLITQQSEQQDKHAFITIIFPHLSQILEKNNSDQITYLFIKFLWKCLRFDSNVTISNIAYSFMPMIRNIISANNTNVKIDDQKKYSPEFYYFRTKKWAMRIIQKFISKHAKLQKVKDKNQKQFANKWYKQYGFQIIQIIFEQLTIPTIKKIRFFQIKCFFSLLSENPQLLQKYAQKLQYEILIPYLQLKPQDQQNALEQPVEFIANQEEGIVGFTNLKRVSTDLWIGLSQLLFNKKQKVGVNFYENMKFLQNLLGSQNLLEKQMAMYLICKMREIILRSPMKDMIPNLVSSYAIPQFQNKIAFLRARAIQIFSEYAMTNFPIDSIQVITQGIYRCLTQDQSPLVRIKAGIAFNCILKQKTAKQLVKPVLKDILTTYLQIMNKYDYEALVNSLESIVELFDQDIGPYAYDLSKCLMGLFSKLFHKDSQASQRQDYAGQIQLAAAGCIKAVNKIIDSPIPSQVIERLYPEMVQLTYFILSTGIDYMDDILNLLNSYIFKLQKLTPDMWFFYQAFIYYIIGISQQNVNKIDYLEISDQAKKILKQFRTGGNVQMMEATMPVLRNFMSKGSQTMLNCTDVFGNNLLQLLLILIDDVYRQAPLQYLGQVQMNCSTILLVYMLENSKNLPQIVIQRFWQVARRNLTIKYKKVKVINIQLICMLLWSATEQVLKILISQNALDKFFDGLTMYIEQFQQQHQRIRIILGLGSLISFKDRSTYLHRFQQIYSNLIRLIKQNIEIRQDYQKGEQKENDNDFNPLQGDGQSIDSQQEDFDNILKLGIKGECDDDDEGGEFWEEMYGDFYSSKLDDIDQIKYFGQVMQRIQRQQPNFYSQLFSIMPKDQLLQLGKRMEHAINLYNKS